MTWSRTGRYPSVSHSLDKAAVHWRITFKQSRKLWPLVPLQSLGLLGDHPIARTSKNTQFTNFIFSEAYCSSSVLPSSSSISAARSLQDLPVCKESIFAANLEWRCCFSVACCLPLMLRPRNYCIFIFLEIRLYFHCRLIHSFTSNCRRWHKMQFASTSGLWSI